MVKIADQYKDKGLVVLGLAQHDTPEMLRAFAAEHKMNYPLLLSTEEVEEAFGPLWAVPMSFFIDRDGVDLSQTHRAGHQGAGRQGAQAAPVV